MVKSIFPFASIDREKIHWEDYIFNLTPVEFHKQCYFKREDYFAPLGYGGLNGGKLRQAVYLGSLYLKDPKMEYLVGAMSSHSPQLVIQTAVAKHFGKKTITICPGINLQKVLQHRMPALAAWFGSEFWLCTIGYNGVLQKRARELQNYLGGKEKAFYLEYATLLGLEHSAQEIYDFHSIGAEQVKNIPEEVEDLIVPVGSCNSSSSIFLGLSKFRPKTLKRIYLITTGPNKVDYLTRRLEKMQEVANMDLKIFKGLPYKGDLFYPVPNTFPYEVIVLDQQKEGFSSYRDFMPFTYDEIEFHPTYEGKIMAYIDKKYPNLLHPKSLFWIVGSYTSRKAMEPFFKGQELNKAKLFPWDRPSKEK